MLGSVFQSTRPLRGATPVEQLVGMDQAISIHAPLAGRDDDGGRKWGLT